MVYDLLLGSANLRSKVQSVYSEAYCHSSLSLTFSRGDAENVIIEVVWIFDINRSGKLDAPHLSPYSAES